MTDDALTEYFPTTFSRELLNMMRGDKLGEGIARSVYVFEPNPRYVLKFEHGNHSFQNAMEWETWEALAYNPAISKWLAPCARISSCGLILMQARTYPMYPAKRPKLIPHWATDIKDDNWGLLKGKPVIHDYGYTKLLSNATARLVKPKWVGGQDFQTNK